MRALLAALLLAPPAAAEPPQVRASRIGVLPFETAHIGASGLIASDLFNTFLVRSYPGLLVVERSKLERVLGEQAVQHAGDLVDAETAAKLRAVLGVEAVVLGQIIAMERDLEGGGTLMMAARLVDTSSARILWAQTVTVRVRESAGKRFLRFFIDSQPPSDRLVTGRLLEQAAFDLVQDLGRLLPAQSLRPAPQGGV